MSDDLDFSDLSDDQLVELATALAREAMSRNPALQAAFEQSILDEKERVEAAARGRERAKRDESARLEKASQAAFEAESKERARRRAHSTLIRYLNAIAGVIALKPENLTLVWAISAHERDGRRLHINLGQTTDRARWHLVDFGADDGRLYVSPGHRRKQAELLPLCRETVAAIESLGIDRTTVIKGVEQL